MTRVTTRSKLDSLLGQIDKTLLVVIGTDEATLAVDEHATGLAKEGKLRSDQVPLRMDDDELLTTAEADEWEAAPGRYVTLRADEAGERVIGEIGAVADLMRVDGVTPSTLAIKRAFRAGADA